MRIDRLHLQNFKGFEDREFSFHPRFNLIVGVNGAGKTSVLDSLAVAIGSWLLGLSTFHEACKARPIDPNEVRLAIHDNGEKVVNYERQFPSVVRASGIINDVWMTWERRLEGVRSRTSRAGTQEIRDLGHAVCQKVMHGEEVTLPLISYYGTGRIWQQPRDMKKRRATSNTKSSKSRFEGYRESHDPRSNANDLFRWIQTQQYISLEEGEETPALAAVKKAVINCIAGGKQMRFSVKLADLLVKLDRQGEQPFNNLSDGYRNVIAMVGDIAFKSVVLNPHLGKQAPQKTPGIVLVDELDLHLHPRWQQRIIDDLKRTFPAMQFICTSHSPFLIQSLAPGELLRLDRNGTECHEYSGCSIEDIVEDIQEIEMPQRSRRDAAMNAAAGEYFRLLRLGKKAPPDALRQAELAYRQASEPYSTNPGLNALLKLEAMAAMKE